MSTIANNARVVVPALIANGLPPRKAADVAWAIGERLFELERLTLTEIKNPTKRAEVDAASRRDNLHLQFGVND